MINNLKLKEKNYVKMSENFENRWRNMVFNKSITEEESLKFYDTWAETVNFVKVIISL